MAGTIVITITPQKKGSKVNNPAPEPIVVTVLQTIELEVAIPVHALNWDLPSLNDDPEDADDLSPRQLAEREVIELLQNHVVSLGETLEEDWALINLESNVATCKAYTVVFPDTPRNATASFKPLSLVKNKIFTENK